MPSIASVNYTVTQGDQAREMQNIRNFAQDANQPVVAEKFEKKEEEKRITVQESEHSETDKLKVDKDKKEKQKRRRRRDGSSKNDSKNESAVTQATVQSAKRSRLLDIVA
ncbi:hypothetical protein MHK_007920 [Candidatus Magnetomorum sp. HK-1]|nr:hypothetical protein MHK_007920 [Candidatus Magnetomorum sp. HK-1]